MSSEHINPDRIATFMENRTQQMIAANEIRERTPRQVELQHQLDMINHFSGQTALRTEP